MKTLITLLILVSVSTVSYSKPDFSKIESFNYSRYISYEKIDFYENQYFVQTAIGGEGGLILIFDSSFLLKDSISQRQLLNYLKDDLNLQEWDYVVISDFAIDSSGKLWLATHKGVVVYDITKKEIVKSYHYKNSVLPQTQIFNIFIEKDTIVIYPNANEIYYFSDNKFTKVKFPTDTTGEFTRLPYPNNAVFHRGKFYSLTGFSKNLVVFDGENFSLYDSENYIVDKYQPFGHLLNCYNGSVYFFEITNRLNLIKFTEGEFSVTDFNKSGIFTIPNNCNLAYYNFEFDTIGNLWLSYQTYDTVTNNKEKYLLRYNSVTDFNLYKIEDLISGYNDGYLNISIIPETNEIFLSTPKSIYKTDLNTDVKETAENLPNLFLLNVFPNPAKDMVMINFSTLPSLIPNLTVKIYNYLGIQISNLPYELKYNLKTGLGTIEADVSGFNWGLYMLVLDNGDNIRSKNLIIQK